MPQRNPVSSYISGMRPAIHVARYMYLSTINYTFESILVLYLSSYMYFLIYPNILATSCKDCVAVEYLQVLFKYTKVKQCAHQIYRC